MLGQRCDAHRPRTLLPEGTSQIWRSPTSAGFRLRRLGRSWPGRCTSSSSAQNSSPRGHRSLTSASTSDKKLSGVYLLRALSSRTAQTSCVRPSKSSYLALTVNLRHGPSRTAASSSSATGMPFGGCRGLHQSESMELSRAQATNGPCACGWPRFSAFARAQARSGADPWSEPRPHPPEPGSRCEISPSEPPPGGSRGVGLVSRALGSAIRRGNLDNVCVTSPSQLAREPFPTAGRELLAQDGRSIRELAPLVGVSFPYLSRLLRGERPASIKQIERVAEVLGVPGSYFLEVRLARINEYLRTHPQRLEALWDELPVDVD